MQKCKVKGCRTSTNNPTGICVVHKNTPRFREGNTEMIEEPEDNKDRVGKLRPSLLVPGFILGMIKVLTFGASKYYPYSWQKVKDPIESYSDALERHWLAFRMGEVNDDESNLHHLFHLATNAMFLWWYKSHEAVIDRKSMDPNS